MHSDPDVTEEDSSGYLLGSFTFNIAGVAKVAVKTMKIIQGMKNKRKSFTAIGISAGAIAAAVIKRVEERDPKNKDHTLFLERCVEDLQIFFKKIKRRAKKCAGRPLSLKKTIYWHAEEKVITKCNDEIKQARKNLARDEHIKEWKDLEEIKLYLESYTKPVVLTSLDRSEKLGPPPDLGLTVPPPMNTPTTSSATSISSPTTTTSNITPTTSNTPETLSVDTHAEPQIDGEKINKALTTMDKTPNQSTNSSQPSTSQEHQRVRSANVVASGHGTVHMHDNSENVHMTGSSNRIRFRNRNTGTSTPTTTSTTATVSEPPPTPGPSTEQSPPSYQPPSYQPPVNLNHPGMAQQTIMAYGYGTIFSVDDSSNCQVSGNNNVIEHI